MAVKLFRSMKTKWFFLNVSLWIVNISNSSNYFECGKLSIKHCGSLEIERLHLANSFHFCLTENLLCVSCTSGAVTSTGDVMMNIASEPYSEESV